MTSISSAISTAINSALLAELGAQMGKFMNFGQMNITPGLISGGCVRPAADPFTATMPQDGKCSIDLGDGYTMQIDESNSEIIIRDAGGNDTKIWGDPHVDVNGQRVGDFYGTTTFELKNGTKITINTEPFGNNPNAWVASQVVVTKGSQALTIDGVSQNQLGDVKVTMGGNGYALDAAHDDGLVVHERSDGAGWISSLTGQNVTQQDFNTTLPGAEQPNALPFDVNLGAALGLWLVGAQMGSLLGLLSGAGITNDNATSASSSPGLGLFAELTATIA